MSAIRILYVSSVPWSWIKQRPHFMAEGLARAGHEVVYCALAPQSAGWTHPEIPRLRIQEIELLRGYMRLETVRALLRRRISRALGSAKFDAVIFTNPVQTRLLPDGLQSGRCYYDCMDLLGEFYTGRVWQSIGQWEQTLCDRADGIFCSSAPLGEFLETRYHSLPQTITVIRNGYEPAALSGLEKKALASPSLVYLGTLDHHWLDVDALKGFACRHGEFTVYLVGPATPQVSALWPENVRFTGPLPHREALSYAAGAGVTCIPFRKTPLIECVDPVKLYEYIALGKPVVTAQWAALSPFGEYENLRIYRDAADFERQVLLSVNQRCSVPEHFSQDCSWESRITQVLAVFGH